MPQRLALWALLAWLPTTAQAAPRSDADPPAARRGFPRMLVDRDVRAASHEESSDAALGARDVSAESASAKTHLPAVDTGTAEAIAVPLAPRGQTQPLPLAPPDKSSSSRAGRSGATAIGTALGSLAIVLALFLGVAWVLRRGLPASGQILPRDVLEVLGRSPLPGRQQVHLMRLGNKLLLVWASGQAVETLAEVTDPQEVDRLTGLCQQAHPSSASNAFRQVFQQFAGERGPRPDSVGRDASRAPAATVRKWPTVAAVEDDDV